MTLYHIHYHLIQISVWLLLLPIIKACVIWEGVRSEKSLGIRPNNRVHWGNSSILTSWKIRWKCSFIFHWPNTCTIVIFANFKDYGNECLWEWTLQDVGSFQCSPKLCQRIDMKWNLHCYNKTLDFMVILNMLSLHFKTSCR
jgi:hypothetical protein